MPNGTATALERRSTATIRVERTPGRCALSVEPDPLALSKAQQHKATWKIQGADHFTIEFQGDSPFDRKDYDEQTAKSVPLRPNAKESRYKYKVKVENCGELDPEVIVGQ